MAEIILKIGPGSDYADGDVLCAINRRQTLYTHADRLCHFKFANRNAAGNMRLNTIAYARQNRIRQWRFERVSNTEVKRILLEDMSEEILDNVNVELWLSRRQQKVQHMIFGTAGNEVWFGGRTDTSLVTTNLVWDDIEANTARNRTQPRFRHWPMGRLDIRSHLPIRMAAMNEAEVERFLRPAFKKRPNGDFEWRRIDPDTGDDLFSWSATNPDLGGPLEYEWEKVQRRKRRHRIPWRNILGDLGVSEATVLDKAVPVGEEMDEDGKTGYRSKTQIDQEHTRIEDQGDIE